MEVLRVWNDIFISLTQIFIFGWTIILYYLMEYCIVYYEWFIHSLFSLMCIDISDDLCNSIIAPIQQYVTHMKLQKLATIWSNIDKNPINLQWTKSRLALRFLLRFHYSHTPHNMEEKTAIWKKRLQFPLYAEFKHSSYNNIMCSCGSVVRALR